MSSPLIKPNTRMHTIRGACIDALCFHFPLAINQHSIRRSRTLCPLQYPCSIETSYLPLVIHPTQPRSVPLRMAPAPICHPFKKAPSFKDTAHFIDSARRVLHLRVICACPGDPAFLHYEHFYTTSTDPACSRFATAIPCGRCDVVAIYALPLVPTCVALLGPPLSESGFNQQSPPIVLHPKQDYPLDKRQPKITNKSVGELIQPRSPLGQ